MSKECLGENYIVSRSTNLFFEVKGFPGLFVKLVSICQQSEDIVSCITVSPEVFVRDPSLFFLQLKGREIKVKM